MIWNEMIGRTGQAKKKMKRSQLVVLGASLADSASGLPEIQVDRVYI